MQPIPPTTPADAPSAAQPVLKNIKAKFGKLPNIFATIANSPTAIKALMGMFGAFEEGALNGKPHEAIACACQK